MHANAITNSQTPADQPDAPVTDTCAKSAGSNSTEASFAGLSVDSSYTRELDEARVAKIVTEWNSDLFESPLVGRRPDGSLWVIDGQHRVEAAKRLGFDAVHAIVIPVDSVAREAYLAVAHNGGLT